MVLREDVDNAPADDDEHRLIARYTARLAADANNAVSHRHCLYYFRLQVVSAFSVFTLLVGSHSVKITATTVFLANYEGTVTS